MIGIDLFAGAGGMSLGAKLAGIGVEFAVELDPWACETYRRNHPETTLHAADIRKVTKRTLAKWTSLSESVVLFGGPPCQGFSWSNARTRNQANESNWLFREFLRIAKLLRPDWVVFENVQGIVDTGSGVFVNQIQAEFKKLGYTVWARKLNASEFGVPQYRTRFFLVGSRVDCELEFPQPHKSKLTVDDAIRDLPRLNNGHSDCWMPYGRKKPSSYGTTMRRHLTGCCNNLVSLNAPFVIDRYRHVPQGGNWEDIPDSMMSNYADRSRCHTGIYHRLNASQPSIVIGNYRKNMLIHPEQDRGLSVREAARLQSFPDDYQFTGSIGFQQQQVGNAVPPLLAKRVFESVLNAAAQTGETK